MRRSKAQTKRDLAAIQKVLDDQAAVEHATRKELRALEERLRATIESQANLMMMGLRDSDHCWRLHMRDEHGVDAGALAVGGPFEAPPSPPKRSWKDWVTAGWRVRMTLKVPRKDGSLYEWESEGGNVVSDRASAFLFTNQATAVSMCASWGCNANDEDWSLVEVVRVRRSVAATEGGEKR